jgi:hypothetical protein
VYSNQPEVSLFLNGELLAVQSRHETPAIDNVFLFEVPLAPGENSIQAHAGDLQDTAVFRKVPAPNPDYKLPETEQGKGVFNVGPDRNIRNWFEKSADGELQFPAGRFSIRDPIKELLAHPQTEGVLKEFFPEMLEDPRMKMAKRFSLETIIGFQPDSFPEALVYEVNTRLNRITKDG